MKGPTGAHHNATGSILFVFSSQFAVRLCYPTLLIKIISILKVELSRPVTVVSEIWIRNASIGLSRQQVIIIFSITKH